jgi:hypothetical protein
LEKKKIFYLSELVSSFFEFFYLNISLENLLCQLGLEYNNNLTNDIFLKIFFRTAILNSEAPLHFQDWKTEALFVEKANFIEKVKEVCRKTAIKCSIQMIVRVEDQSRAASDHIKNLAGFIPDGRFLQYFGASPTEHPYEGVNYYLSEVLDAELLNELVASSFFQLFEISFLLVDNENVDDTVESDGGLTAEFVGKNFILGPFKQYVIHVAKFPTVIAKMIHIAQSSGTGKTRLCLELVLDMRAGWYCVYRKENSTGQPKCSPWFKLLFDNFKASMSDDESVLVCLNFIKKLLEHNPFARVNDSDVVDIKDVQNLFLQNSKTRSSISSEFIAKTTPSLNVKSLLNAFFTTTENLTASTATSAPNSQENPIFARERDNLVSEIRSIASRYPSEAIPLIFDECQEMLEVSGGKLNLISLYRAMRRALILVQDTKIVAIFLETKSSLNEFVLNWRIDASLRTAVPENFILVPPYILTDNFDVRLKKVYLIDPDKFEHGKFVSSKVLEKIATRSGRPLWSIYKKYDAAFDVALTKINVEAGMVDLTCFIMRTGALIIPQSSLSHELVLSGLATLLHVDTEGNNCLTCYFPEPMLSNAARIRMTDDCRFLAGLEEFLIRMNAGTFRNTGVAGEVVAKLLLLRGFDRSLLKRWEKGDTSNDNHYKFIYRSGKFVSPKHGLTTAREFLVSFTGLTDKELAQLDPNEDLLDGYISINQFTQLNTGAVVDQLFLMNGFARSTAFSLWHNAPGADLILPLMKKSGDFGCIAIQAKNYSHRPNPALVQSFVDKMSVDYMTFLQFPEDFSIEESVIRIVIYFDPEHQTAAPVTSAPIKPVSDRAARIVAANRIAAANAAEYGTSLIKFCNSTIGDFKVLWIEGLPALEHLFRLPGQSGSTIPPLQEKDVWTANVNANADTYDSIKALLFRIISHERSYYDGVKFLANTRFSYRQTTRNGAESLYITASPCADNRYLSLFEAQAKYEYKEKRTEVLKLFASVDVNEEMTKFREYAFISKMDSRILIPDSYSSESSTTIHLDIGNDFTPSANTSFNGLTKTGIASTVLGAAVAVTEPSSEAVIALATAAVTVGITAIVTGEMQRMEIDEVSASSDEFSSTSMASPHAKRFKN